MDASSDTVVFKLVAEELTSTDNKYTCMQAEKPVAMYFYRRGGDGGGGD